MPGYRWASGLVDRIENAAIRDQLFVNVRPTFPDLCDAEKLHAWETARMFLQYFRICRPVKVLRDDLLSFRGVQEFEVGLGGRAGFLPVHVLVDDSHVGFGTNADRRIDNIQRTSGFLNFKASLVFPCEMNVADPLLYECRRGRARARVEHGHLLVEFGDIVDSLLTRAAAKQDQSPRCVQAELAVAGGLRIGRHD
jgi:hypothetical protein